MREWQLTPADPMAPRIAADARTGRTNYHDDQVWQLVLGGPTEPAFSLETRYGGRIGLARIVPMWVLGRRQVYETQGYYRAPVLTAFAPDYLRLHAALTNTIDATIEFFAFESQVVGGRFTCKYSGDQPEPLRIDLNAQAQREQKSTTMYFLTLENNQVALQMGKIGNLEPLLMLEGAAQTGTSARLSSDQILKPGQTLTVRWVLASTANRDNSLLLAHRWLNQTNWDQEVAALEARAAAIPDIHTGHTDWDLALAWSQQITVRCLMGATGSLPNASFVMSRKPNLGYSAGGVHAGGFSAIWGGQSIPDALVIAPTVAIITPEIAKGIVRNFLAVQREDGFIDARPGLDGQRTGEIAPPLLAALAYTVYHYTQDHDFLSEIFDDLLAFFERWFKPEMDLDGDGLPEWRVVDQGAFGESPTLAQHRRWAQGVDVNTVETPDLAAYLIREASILTRVATLLKRKDKIEALEARITTLEGHLKAMWKDGAFRYRDRDTHLCPTGELVFEGKGDQTLAQRITLPTSSRVIVRISGGMSRKPNLSCTIEGADVKGQTVREVLEAKVFDWYVGAGTATSKTVWRDITSIKFEALSRVYNVQVSTVNLARHDQSLFMPLWTKSLDKEYAEQMVSMLTDPTKYWRKFGIPGCPANDPAYDPTQQNGCGAIWPRWTYLIAWSLLDRGYMKEAADLFKRLLSAQIQCLTKEHAFFALYNPDTGQGLGDTEVVTGVVSMGWFARLFGGHVVAPDAVAITGPIQFEGESMQWNQHGIVFKRSAEGTTITFPTGYEVKLKPDAEPQIVKDPTPKPAPVVTDTGATLLTDIQQTPPTDGLLPAEDS